MSASKHNYASAMQMSAAKTVGFGSVNIRPTNTMMPRVTSVTMNAAATAEAVKEGWADFTFYAQKYDKESKETSVFSFKDELMKNAKFLSTPGRGILASDESNMTCGKRLEGIGLTNSEEMRRKWRECIYSTPDLGKYCSGVIMYDETAR